MHGSRLKNYANSNRLVLRRKKLQRLALRDENENKCISRDRWVSLLAVHRVNSPWLGLISVITGWLLIANFRKKLKHRVISVSANTHNVEGDERQSDDITKMWSREPALTGSFSKFDFHRQRDCSSIAFFLLLASSDVQWHLENMRERENKPGQAKKLCQKPTNSRPFSTALCVTLKLVENAKDFSFSSRHCC